jgi:hypothetical protein
MGRSRNFHSKKTRATRKKSGVTFKTHTYPAIPTNASALYKQYRDIHALSSSKRRRKYVNDVPLTASPDATDKQKNASLSRSNTALRLGKRYAPLNEADTLRKLLTKQLHVLELMKKGIEQKENKDDDETELSDIESTIYQNNRLLKNPPGHVDIAEPDTTIHNVNRYRSTEKLIQSLRNKYQKKSNYANRIK